VGIVGVLSLPFIALAIGGYMMVRAFGRWARPKAPPIPAQPVQPAPAVAAAPTTPQSPHQPQPPSPTDLPPEIAGTLARIGDKAAALRAPEQVGFVSVEDRQHIERTLDEYLVNILATFRALPKGSEEWQVEPEGETAIQLVLRQLHLLEESLDMIAQRVFQAGAAQLTAQQRFLEERLGQPQPPDLGLPPPPTA
jgi:hypothetical protein